METGMIKLRRFLVAAFAAILFSSGVAAAFAQDVPSKAKQVVTFIELGSVNCVPCKAMQPIMETVRQKYGAQVSVVFHDVWTDAGKPFAKQFGIRVIPTQVFLDRDGKEYFRHEGFFPAEQLYLILEKGGVRL
jgi:thioredoxin 1